VITVKADDDATKVVRRIEKIHNRVIREETGSVEEEEETITYGNIPGLPKLEKGWTRQDIKRLLRKVKTGDTDEGTYISGLPEISGGYTQYHVDQVKKHVDQEQLFVEKVGKTPNVVKGRLLVDLNKAIECIMAKANGHPCPKLKASDLE